MAIPRRLRAADMLRKSRAAPKGQKLAFLGFGRKKKKKVLGTGEAEAAPTPEKPKDIIGRGRQAARDARRKKLIAAGFTPAEAAEMEP